MQIDQTTMRYPIYGNYDDNIPNLDLTTPVTYRELSSPKNNLSENTAREIFKKIVGDINQLKKIEDKLVTKNDVKYQYDVSYN